LRSLGHIALILCTAGCAAACTAVVDSAVEGRYAQYNYSTDWAKNEAILLNIVRASEYQPLNFMSFQPYQGTASVTGAASSPGFIIGPARANSQKQYTFGEGALTASASGTGTVTVTTLDTQNFYEALLASVDFKDLYRFQSQGYPRELLFRLFADYVSLSPATGDPRGKKALIISNDPSPQKSCYPPSPPPDSNLPPPKPQICFDQLVVFALLSGLSSEIRTVPDPAASSAKSNGAKTDQHPTITEGRLCFDPALANRAWFEYRNRGFPPSITNPGALRDVEYHPICGVDKWIDATQNSATSVNNTTAGKLAALKKNLEKTKATANAAPGDQMAKKNFDTAQAAFDAALNTISSSNSTKAAGAKLAPGLQTLKVSVRVPTGDLVWDMHIGKHHTVVFGTRSTFSTYNFLGRLLNRQDSPANMLVGPPSEDDYDRHILTVLKGEPATCFVSAAVFHIGAYCVPIDGAQNTKSTFSILSQLLALKTTTGDLQLLPTIRLLPTD
jgi:hypothetical protein